MTVTHKKVDIVTIGAGWTAAIFAARILPKKNLQMVSIEQGPARWTYPEFSHDHDGLRYAARYAMMQDLGKETWTWRPNPSAPTLPYRQYGSFNPGQGVGGSAVHWSGQMWRFLDSDFKYRSHTIERYGKDRIPDGCTVQDWGITYGELERYYDEFEYDIGVSGQTGNLNGRIIPGGNPFEEPRTRPYPLGPLAVNELAYMFRDATQNLGWHPFPHPSGILSHAWTDPFGHQRGGCLYCGYCTRFGCEVDAKSSPITTHLPVALETGRYEVRTGCKVLHIDTADNGLASGITYVDSRGTEHVQPAELVVVSAFTFSNVRMLLLSRGKKHPHGIGNDRGRVGKNYTYQLFQVPAKGLWEGKPLNMYMGNTTTVNCIYDWNSDNFDHSDLDFIGGALMYSQPCERQPLRSIDSIPKGLTDASWGRPWKDMLRNWDSIAGIQIEAESLPYEDQFLDLDPVYNDKWGQPLLRITFDFHENDRKLYRFVAGKAAQIVKQMRPTKMTTTPELDPYNIHDYQTTHPTGGAIMGTDPGNSVCNNYGQVWDTPNVFVTGAALYPQNPGANPTGTVGPLAYRTADALRERWFDHPNELLE
jgi:gluconate 2-dehydrogenase alpha chain